MEANEAAAALARARLSVDIHASAVEELQLPEEKFDLITMSHCLEHTYSPGRVLGQVHRWLKPNGRLLVMVPNYDAMDRRLFGERWLGFEVPRHLYHFDERCPPTSARAAEISRPADRGALSAAGRRDSEPTVPHRREGHGKDGHPPSRRRWGRPYSLPWHCSSGQHRCGSRRGSCLRKAELG